MATPVKFIPNGDYKFHETAGGRDETIWLDVIEFDDGTRETFAHPNDERRNSLIEMIEANKELTK